MVRKYLRSDGLRPVQGAGAAEPSGSVADKLSRWLGIEAGKERKVRRTARQPHVVLGYDGSYARVAAFVPLWRFEREVTLRITGRCVLVPLLITADRRVDLALV